MSEFKTGFIDAYRAELIAMLDLGDELSLVHSPDVVIQGNLSTQDLNINVAGRSLTEQDPESVEGVQAHRDAQVGISHLHGLAARATMYLFASEIGAVLPAGIIKPTPEQEKVADDIIRKAQAQIQEAEHSYSAYHFINNGTGEIIEVTSSHIASTSSAIRVRDLSLSISDAYIKKEVAVSEIPTSFGGQTAIDIQQKISPIADETLHKAAELFYNNGSPEDMGIILTLFTTELTGHGDATQQVEGLIARFEANGKAEQLRKILAEIKQKAKEAKLGSAFNLASPEMALPSAADLDEYKTLLSQIRS